MTALDDRATVGLRRVVAAEDASVDGLIDLLVDTVHGGASVGFLAPLSRDTAARYWRQVLASLGGGALVLWVAESDSRIVGSVQLALCEKENGRHRADVQKLIILRSHRGRGVSSALLAAAESFARADGRTLLVLDTVTGSFAETVYRHLGWQRVGEIPDYAAN